MTASPDGLSYLYEDVGFLADPSPDATAYLYENIGWRAVNTRDAQVPILENITYGTRGWAYLYQQVIAGPEASFVYLYENVRLGGVNTNLGRGGNVVAHTCTDTRVDGECTVTRTRPVG